MSSKSALYLISCIVFSISYLSWAFAQLPASCGKGEKLKNYSKRVELLTDCISSPKFKETSKTAKYFLKRGFGYEKIGKPAMALKDYLKAIELNPKYSSAYYNAGTVYLNTARYDQAIEYFNTSLTYNPGFAFAYFNRGLAYMKKKEWEKAIQDFDQVVKRKKKFIPSYYNRGLCYANLNRFKEAIRDYDKTISLDPKYILAYNNLGFLLFKFGYYEKAVEIYTKGLKIDKNNVSLLSNRAAAYSRLNKFKLALTDYDALIAVGTSEINPYYNKGLCYQQMDDIPNAIKSYEKAIEIKPNFTWPYNNLAIILISSEKEEYRNPQRAVELLLKAMKISGKRIPAYNSSLAAAYAHLGDFEKAVKFQKIALDIAKERKWAEKIKECENELEAYKTKEIPVQKDDPKTTSHNLFTKILKRLLFLKTKIQIILEQVLQTAQSIFPLVEKEKP